MKKLRAVKMLMGPGLLAVGALVFQGRALADSNEDTIKELMKVYHKAPKGVDPICKKAVQGQASPEEIKKLIECYKTLAGTKPPKGDLDSWKEKTTKLVATSQALEKGTPEARDAYKEALNCKACHTAHKPD